MLDLAAHMLDVLAEATHGAAARADKCPDGGSEKKKSEALDGCFHNDGMVAVVGIQSFLKEAGSRGERDPTRAALLLLHGIHFGLGGGSFGISLLFVRIQLRLIRRLLGLDVGL